MVLRVWIKPPIVIQTMTTNQMWPLDTLWRGSIQTWKIFSSVQSISMVLNSNLENILLCAVYLYGVQLGPPFHPMFRQEAKFYLPPTSIRFNIRLKYMIYMSLKFKAVKSRIRIMLTGESFPPNRRVSWPLRPLFPYWIVSFVLNQTLFTSLWHCHCHLQGQDHFLLKQHFVDWENQTLHGIHFE